MKLKDYLSRSGRSQATLAGDLGVTGGFIWQLCDGRRPCPAHTAIAIERWTDGAVTRADLRPADWREIWPEYTPPEAQEAKEAQNDEH